MGKKFSDYSAEELRAISRKAGVNSGKARREKRQKIEAEKLHDIAMRETRREASEAILRSARLLLQAEKLSEKYNLGL